jgi:predicted nucleotide-binding protein
MIKVRSSLAELKAALASCELEGDWYKNTVNGFHSFHAETGEVLNWWPSTGTVQFQGKRREEFKALFSNALTAQPLVAPRKPPAAAKLFVLQSRDRKARDEIERVLIHHGLQPIALQKGDGSSQPIVEALNQYIRERTGFEIVMLSLRK